MLKEERGFTLIEIGVALAVIALLAVALVPQMLNRLQSSESGALVANLAGLTEAVASFRADVGRYPVRLSHLTTPISIGTKDICGVNIPTAVSWQGPYLNRSVTSAGIAVGSATVRDSLVREPAGAGVITTASGAIAITVFDVDRSAADAVDANLDGDGALTGTGAVTWDAVGTLPNRGTLTFRIPIRGC